MATTPYPFVANAILTASQLNSSFNIPVTTKTASAILVAADAGTRVVMNSASATTITVNTSLFSAGDNLEILNIGAGVCTLTAGTATVSTSGTLALVANAGGTLYFTSTGVSVFQATGVAASSGALVLITAVSFTSQTTVSMATGIFTSTYKNYLVTLNVPTGSSGAISARVNNSGTPRTTNYYGGSGRYGSNNTNTMVASSAATSLNLIDAASAEAFGLTINVYDPLNASGKTAIAGYGLGVNAAGFPASSVTGGVYYTAEANDGLTFIFAASSTGFYRVYGLADA